MGAFKWYIGLLKSKPVVANLGSAFVLMSVGDVMAQEIELNCNNNSDHDDNNKTTPLRRYRSSRIGGGSATTMIHHHQQQQLERNNNHTGNNHTDEYAAAAVVSASSSVSTTPVSPPISVEEVINNCTRRFKYEMQQLDFIRTGTMLGWTVGAYTPFYIQVFKLLDKYMPKQASLTTVSIRVMTCFMLSIPINAAFFVYGSFVHQLREDILPFVSKNTNNNTELNENNNNKLSISRSNNHDITKLNIHWDQMLIASKRKLDAELYNTVVASGSVWIPFNFILFTLVPPHLRPLNVMVCGLFWNCYLSLVQHRAVDVNVVDDHDHNEDAIVVVHDNKQKKEHHHHNVTSTTTSTSVVL